MSHAKCILLLLLSAPVVAAAAEDTTGNKMLTTCQTVVDLMDGRKTTGTTADAGVCMGYLSGVRDMDIIYGTVNKSQSICVGEATPIELARAVVKYFKSHTKELNSHPSYSIPRALISAYPCQK